MGGVVRCADCGSTLVFQKPRYMICNGYVHGRCVSRQSITVDVLHEAVLEKLRADLAFSAPLRYELAASAPDGAELRALELRLANLEKKLHRVRDAYASGIDTLEDYARYKTEIEAESDRIRQKISEVTARRDPCAAESSLRESIRNALETLEAPDRTKEEKNAAIKQIVETCAWDKSTSNLTIIYRVLF